MMKLCSGLGDFDEFVRLTEGITSFSSVGIRPGLRRVSRLFGLLGSPQLSLRTIHVLGTNGKGSTAAALEAVLKEAGFKTALYTSPHLISLQERLRIDGMYASLEDWRASWDRITETVERDRELSSDRPSFFEHFTALCVMMMKEAGADMVILEAGMGGRYDATSVCSPIATLINPIGMDHMQYLGPTIEAIAGEKFAAVKKGRDAFYAGDDGSLTPMFLGECEASGAIPHVLDRMAFPSDIACTLEGTSFSYSAPEVPGLDPGYRETFFTPLAGRHQAYNSARVITTLLTLKNKFPEFASVDSRLIKRGFEKIDWPCRLELTRTKDGRGIILDGAHNNHAMRALVSSIGSMPDGDRGVRVGGIVFAVMKDKDIPLILGTLKSLGSPIYCTEVRMERSEKAGGLAAEAERCGMSVAGVFKDPSDALKKAMAETGPDEFILCCGSLFLAGYIRKLLKFDGIY
ncbi:MAG: bifunctional folylpolyglutamate synthase/dihydrofolate synthase [Synergistaceae bacterium]|jgi:dihydrofolate synthase/folylpolyglutamate synthase|nr:bifunctional folylpolyglutamate synthase/dihydrofolate synthase [Synergistaceae bacterium]